MTRLLGSSFLWLLPMCAHAQDWEPPPLPRTNSGTIGLIEMPSARMADDGELSAGASYFKSTQRYNLGFQILPWLEGSFRYSGVSHFDPAYPVYWDRSFGMKLHLWEEGSVLPAVALGMNDLVGTGLYSGEYVVASKQFGPFDATLGLGWGRLGSANTFRNPFAQISHSFETRPSLTSPGGTNFNAYFHGPKTGLFGGVTWRTPLPGLTAIVEASSDAYPFERVAQSFAGPGFYPHTQMNYGLSYQATEGMTLGMNWLYGRSLGASLSFAFNPTKPLYPATISTPPVAPVLRSGEAQQAALRTMLERRDPHQSARRASLQARTADKNAFVDALMARDDIADIRISGTTLALTMNRNAPEANCQALARTAQYSGTDIRQILVRRAGGGAQRCSVPRAVEPVFQDIAMGSAHLDFAAMPANLLTIDAAPPAAPVDTAAAVRKFKASAKAQNITIEAVSFGESTATVYYTNTTYFAEADAIERLTRILMAEAPPAIEKFQLVSVLSGVAQQQYTVLRAPVERAFAQNSETASVFDSAPLIDAPSLYNPVLNAADRKTYPRFNWSIFPQIRQQFFDPNNPFGVQLLGAVAASLDLAPGLSIWGQGEASIFDTFATDRPNDSLLPHVRTDFLKYFTHGKNGIAALEADYRFRLAPEVFATVKGGYLESMFAGVGGEVLWRPQSQRWAVGADLYDVWQREYDRLFGLLPYHRVTGHVTLYYASPWYDLDFQLRAGQYLAGDRGLTLQVTRRFSTGIEVGAFVTKTNVSATQFGEGSFDKGIVIRIPINWIAPIDSQNQVAVDLRPVQRDGGQTLAGDATLYEETRRASESEIFRSGKGFAEN